MHRDRHAVALVNRTQVSVVLGNQAIQNAPADMLPVAFQDAAPYFLKTLRPSLRGYEIFQLLELELAFARDDFVAEPRLLVDTAREWQRRRFDLRRIQR